MSQQSVSNGVGTLYVVATPIGNLGDFSHRAEEVLRSVSCIAAEDTRHTRRLLQHYGIGTPLMPLHEHNEARAMEKVMAMLRGGESVALVSDAGTPLVSDPGFLLVRECRRQGVKVSPVPGPSALVAALSVSGLPTDRFCFHGFLPRQRHARREKLDALRNSSATLVFYESSHRIESAMADLAEVLGPQRRGCLARELTKRHEEILDGTLAELAERVAADADRRRGEFVVLVAPAEASATDGRVELEADRLLLLLLEELPLKQAVSLAARLTGGNKNRLYQRALELR